MPDISLKANPILGLHIYKLLTDVWRTNSLGIIPYYIIGYLLPLLMVIISIICNEALDLRGYGNYNHCWLSPEKGFIWAFMGPVAVIVIVNIIIFTIAMIVARRAISNNKNMDTAAEIVTQIKVKNYENAGSINLNLLSTRLTRNINGYHNKFQVNG